MLSEQILNIFKEKKITLSTAESCTGGSIAGYLTSISGCSVYFQGSVVSYSNRIKNEVLAVDNELLTTYGAVSKEVVEAMAKGVIKLMKTDYSIAVSGIAGPTGGTKEKPVGTVHVAIGKSDSTTLHKLLSLKGDRNKIVKQTIEKACELLLQCISNNQ